MRVTAVITPDRAEQFDLITNLIDGKFGHILRIDNSLSIILPPGTVRRLAPMFAKMSEYDDSPEGPKPSPIGEELDD